VITDLFYCPPICSVPRTEGAELARHFESKFIETSAKARVNVEEAFYQLVREIRRFNRVSRGFPNSLPGVITRNGAL
jgi:hypothetical protein